MKIEKNMKSIALWILLGLAVVLGVIAFAVWEQNEYTLELNVVGQEEITLEYGQQYRELGATARFYGTILNKEPKDLEVNVQGSVDTATVGTYTVIYSVERMGISREKSRIVHVVDTKSPTISLVTDPDGFTLPGQPYEEEGYSAWDEYDGDLTAQVVRTDKEEEVVYTVADSSGNSCQVIRSVVYNDPEPPVIILEGKTKMTVPAGGSFTEPGFTATDNCDGDVTDRVTVSGGIDPYLPGDYTITYTVEDSFGNAVTASRVVTVGSVYNNGGTNGKIIYLTFDDGPSAHTGYLLNILKKYGVKATFFIVNTGYSDTIARAYNEGHTIAIHSKTHNYKEIYASEDAYLADLYYMQDRIRAITGHTTYMFRFPGGSSNSVSKFNPGIMTRLTQLVREKGFQYFDWNVSSGDAGLVDTSQAVFDNVTKGIRGKKTSVVLQHDSLWYSVVATERIIVWGLVNGYTFLPMDYNSPACHHRVRN